MPPTRIELVGQGEGARLERRENERVEVTCKVWNARPAAEIVWLRNNVPIVGKLYFHLTYFSMFKGNSEFIMLIEK